MALTPINIADRTGAAQAMDQFQDPAGNNIPLVSLDSTKANYRVSTSFTPFATAPVTLVSIQGSASKTVRVKLVMAASIGTSVSQYGISLKRTSALGTGGTVVAPSIGQLDRGVSASYAAATAVVQHYTTAAQTGGTAVGGELSRAIIINTLNQASTPTALAQMATVLFPEFSAVAVGSAIVLRGTADFLEVQNNNGGNLTGAPLVHYVVGWEEDGS